MSSTTILPNAEATGPHPVVPAVSKPSPTPHPVVPVDVDTTGATATVDELAARLAELEAQTVHSIEWAVQWSQDHLVTYSNEQIARSIHANLGLPPEALKASHVSRGPFVSVTA